MRRYIFIVAVHAFTASSAFALYTWQDYNGHQYAITADYGSWTDCENEAIAAGGHLVAIEDAAENAWLSSTFAGYYSLNDPGNPDVSLVWIGLYRPEGEAQLPMNEANWRWVTGEPLVQSATWPNWYSLGGHGGIHAYLHTDTHYQPGTWWEDTVYDTHTYAYVRGIIEVVPEPATLSLLVLGGLFVARRRRA